MSIVRTTSARALDCVEGNAVHPRSAELRLASIGHARRPIANRQSAIENPANPHSAIRIPQFG